jgi:hypothetical protein
MFTLEDFIRLRTLSRAGNHHHSTWTTQGGRHKAFRGPKSDRRYELVEQSARSADGTQATG